MLVAFFRVLAGLAYISSDRISRKGGREAGAEVEMGCGCIILFPSTKVFAFWW